MISICMDDGTIDCFKWCRQLYKQGIKSTIYINPSTIGKFEFLNLYHLNKIQNDWGHFIANHLYSHSDCPANGVSISDILISYNKTKEWLIDNKFTGLEDYLAIPFGNIGGKWSNLTIIQLLKECKQVRDVSTSGLTAITDIDRLYSICDDAGYIIEGIKNYGNSKDKVFTFTLHRNLTTTDESFIDICEVLEDYKNNIKTVNNIKEL